MSNAAQRAPGLAEMYCRDYRFDQHLCAYCGSPRQCIDHVPPLRVARGLDLKKFYKSGGKLRLLPSCNDCNLMLGGRALFTFPERLAALYHSYGRKVKSRTWSDEDIKDLGAGLRGYIAAQDARNRELIAKFHSVERRLLFVDAMEDDGQDARLEETDV